MAQLQKREKILLSVTTACLAVFLIYQFGFGGKKPKKVQSGLNLHEVIQGENKNEPKQAGYLAADLKTQIEVMKLENILWKQDPFANAFLLAPHDSTMQDSSVLVLNGIIRKSGRALALIGNYILSPGERVGDLKLLSIGSDQVICKKGNRTITLSLEK